MRDSLRHFVAEFVGTFALVFVGGAALMMAQGGAGSLGTVAAAHGLILAVMVSAVMRISGHFNPAVTLGFLVTRRIQPLMAAVYVVAQLVGAMAAAYLHKAVVPSDVYAAAHGGTLSIASTVSGGQAFGLEAVATFFLVFTVFGTAVDPQAPKVGGFAIGLTVAADILAIGPMTGAAMNPARAFGPAVAFGQWEGQLIYWVAPIVGGVVAALLYDQLFLPRAPEMPGSGAVQPAKGRGAPREHAV
ncbi:major intrinsic protein [Gemmatirosa kalamazoonensis]|jgi:MIP family channel proteins|uniref:Major intrinsic protein n=1 Tax=Gemmatirosa kalamazoonensis TaxID=861299 RepID=W0RQD1_9BACT|nr:aquaporin [Gemmatirosa kalamazoonensis]AHG91723.1 major intrinsic protein [Gemmatirosa kalamazoonensis]